MSDTAGTELRLRREPLRPGADTPGTPLSDWNLMFDAVTTRLRQVVQASGAGVTEAEHARQVRCDILECAQALDRLHAELRAGRIYFDRAGVAAG